MALSTPARPKIKLSRLREIGWSFWDPISLGGVPANEYDSYLLAAVAMVRRGDTGGAVDYLVAIESEHMGLGNSVEARRRAEATVLAIRGDGDLWSDGGRVTER